MSFLRAAALAAFLALPAPLAAQEILASYGAYIGLDDLYNSDGARLTEPWQVLRQERANYHRFGIRQAGDEWDPLFASIDNRAAFEQMMRAGVITDQARRDILAGGAMIYVTVWRTPSGATRANVDVWRDGLGQKECGC